jgi:hypothetical protein
MRTVTIWGEMDVPDTITDDEIESVITAAIYLKMPEACDVDVHVTSDDEED